jgi:hypothetical protein
MLNVHYAVLLAPLLFVPSTPARTVDLVDNRGSPVGWTLTTPDTPLTNDTLQLLPGATWGDRFFFTLSATMDATNSPLTIGFQRTSDTAPPLAIGSLRLVNGSAEDWTGFRIAVSSPNPGVSLQLSVPGSSTFSIGPFTHWTFSDDTTSQDWTGGTLPRGSTLFAGSTAGGGLPVPGLLLAGTPDPDHFLLTLIPLTSAGPLGQTPIPLPPAAWSALLLLMALLPLSFLHTEMIGPASRLYLLRPRAYLGRRCPRHPIAAGSP